MSDGKYYWLKLKRDFFKRHDIRIIEGLPDGINISHFYIKLMLESVDHEGELRFSEDIPYTPEMLASITYTPLDVVEKSLKVLKDFELVKIDDDGTIRLPKVVKLIDSASDTDDARRQRRYREQKRAECDKMSRQNVTGVTNDVTKDNESKSKSKSKSKSIVIGENPTTKQFKIPTVEEISAYCQERNNSVDAQRFFDYYESKGWYVGKNKMKDWKAAVRTWERQDTPTSHCPTPKKNNPYDIDWSKV